MWIYFISTHLAFLEIKFYFFNKKIATPWILVWGLSVVYQTKEMKGEKPIFKSGLTKDYFYIVSICSLFLQGLVIFLFFLFWIFIWAPLPLLFFNLPLALWGSSHGNLQSAVGHHTGSNMGLQLASEAEGRPVERARIPWDLKRSSEWTVSEGGVSRASLGSGGRRPPPQHIHVGNLGPRIPFEWAALRF